MLRENLDAVLVRFGQLVLSSVLASAVYEFFIYFGIVETWGIHVILALCLAGFLVYNFISARMCCIAGTCLKNYYFSNVIAYALYTGFTFLLWFVFTDILQSDTLFVLTNYITMPFRHYLHAFIHTSDVGYMVIFHIAVLFVMLFVPIGLANDMSAAENLAVWVLVSRL